MGSQFLAINSYSPANLANQTRQLSSRTDEDCVSDRVRGVITHAHPSDFSSKMTQTPQNNTNMDDTSSETSEGSSIEHDQLPTFQEIISGTRHGPHDYVTESVSQAGSATSLVQLGPESLVPPPLRVIINQWCAAQGPGYSLNQLPCTTAQDIKSLNKSYKGTPAAWQDTNGNPMIARMYPLVGTDVSRGRLKILVLEGSSDMQGPSIVSYLQGPSNGKRVMYKRWIGVNGDTDGYEDGIAAVKVMEPQKRTRKRSGTEFDSNSSNGPSNIVIPTQQVSPPRKRLRSSILANDDAPLEKRLAASPQEPKASATKPTSVLSNATSRKNLSENGARAVDNSKPSSKRQVSHKKQASDMPPPVDPTGNATAQRVQPRRRSTQKVDASGSKEVISAGQGASSPCRSPSLRPSEALDVQSPARSHEQATIGERPQRVEVVIEKNGTSSMQIPEPSQSRQQTDMPTPPLTHGSTETTLETPGGERQSTKVRRKLKLNQVFVKFNPAGPLEPSESPRVRPFGSCDTVQKLFNQARTGNVFGPASDVRSGGKLLSVEFRGSGRLPEEVFLVNEEDEEDFRRMRTALLRKDWWTEVEERVYGGGLLDVRHMS